ncbi:hypothetical protein OPT61_g1053 [Boeremia exigua]|uniref:Uncharacterized protein n=1 Tax=Boeremia exigua TaxID=749465 RepID=A0ACC2IS12_9PLEO|nr:hypothetical protein OPT61_g1053 [Boeremia exigua]
MMARPSGGITAAARPRIVQSVTGISLIIALPSPSVFSAPQQSSSPQLPKEAAALPTHDRKFWQRCINSPIILKMGSVVRGLGLRQLNTGPGRITFQSNTVSKLADAVDTISKTLPTTTDQLLDVAVDYNNTSLQQDIAQLLHQFGHELWGANTERSWLLQASDSDKQYPKDLVFESAADRNVLIYHLRLWVLVKAFNRARASAQARSKTASQQASNTLAKSVGSEQDSNSSLPPQQNQTDTRRNAFATTTAVDDAQVLSEETSSSNALDRRSVVDSYPAEKSSKYTSRRKDTERTSGHEDLKSEIGRDKSVGHTDISRDESVIVLTSSDTSNEGKDTPYLGNNLGETSDHQELTTRNDREARRLTRSQKETLTTGSVSKQEPRTLKSKRSPRKSFGRDEAIRSSSDESEDEDIGTLSPTFKDLKAFDNQTRYLASHGKPNRYDSKHHSIPGSTLDIESGTEPSAKQKLPRQPPGACKSCQQRHQRCDRTNPRCGRCVEYDYVCEYFEISKPAPTSSSSSAPRPTQTGIKDVGFDRESVTDNGMVLTTMELPLNRYWNEDEWRSFHLRGNEREILLSTMRSLGLKATLQHDIQFRFAIEHFVSLGNDINEYAWKLSRKLSTVDLVKQAGDKDYLDEEIDLLFETHAAIWSGDADRTKLISPGADKNYPRDLIYEEHLDQRLLWIHLHRWISLIALKNCKQMHKLNNSVTNNSPHMKGAVGSRGMADKSQMESSHMFEASEGTAMSNSRNASSLLDDTVGGPGSCNTKPKDTLEGSGQDTMKNNDQGESDQSLTHTPNLTPETRRQKRKDSSTPSSEQQDNLRATKQRRTHQLDMEAKTYDLVAIFVSYLENFTDHAFDETAALNTLTHELSLLETYIAIEQSHGLVATFFMVSFPAWLSYREEIVAVKRKLVAMPVNRGPSQLHRHAAVVERSQLVSRLRQAHADFVQAGHDELRPEQVMFQTVQVLMRGSGGAQAARDVRDGFCEMENELMGLGEQLMKDGGAKTIMGEFASVYSLDGLEQE